MSLDEGPALAEQEAAWIQLQRMWRPVLDKSGKLVEHHHGGSIKVELNLYGTPVQVLRQLRAMVALELDATVARGGIAAISKLPTRQ